MRFRFKKKNPNIGDKEYRRSFAWIPTKIHDELWVWLEDYIRVYRYEIKTDSRFGSQYNLPQWIIIEKFPCL